MKFKTKIFPLISAIFLLANIISSYAEELIIPKNYIEFIKSNSLPSVTAEPAPAGSLADPVNFPLEEVLLAEKYWEDFAYGRRFNIDDKALWMEYNNDGRGLKTFETPEIYWYFPYFIEFCKEFDLTTYKKDRDYTAFDKVMHDFKSFYLEKSGYQRVDFNTRCFWFTGINEGDDTYIFVKIDGLWQLCKIIDPETAEFIMTVEPVNDSFEPYKPLVITTEEVTTAETKNSSEPEYRQYDMDGNLISTEPPNYDNKPAQTASQSAKHQSGGLPFYQIVIITIVILFAIIGIICILFAKLSSKNTKK